MIRTTLTLIALLAALVAAAPLGAQEVPRFDIERIEVRDYDRVSPEVVIYESRLREGAVYTESDLRDAAARLTRLPFLLGAEFSLEKGTERGRYILIITITETRGFFYRLDLVADIAKRSGVDAGPNSRLGSDDSGAALGWRWFLGRRGALHIALIGRDETEFTRGYSAFAVGYTLYDLFGTKAFATVNLKHSPQQASITPQVVVGMPLSLNQTLTAEYDSTRVDYELFVLDLVEGTSEKQKLARVTWSYNTTNHPFVPTEGTLLTAGPLAVWREDSYGETRVNEDGSFTFIAVPVKATTLGVQGSALRYWEITDRNSLSLGAEAGFGHVELTDRDVTSNKSTVYAAAQTGFSRSLWTPERRALGGDSRLELVVRGRLRSTEAGTNRFRTRNDSMQVTVGWVRHSSWGTLRLGAGYAW